MQAAILVGLQGSGKSTFCRERFFRTHVRINLDMLKTRHRERRLLAVCIETGQPFVVDNTNPTALERLAYIEPAMAAGFRVTGYYFRSRLEECLQRNEARPESERIPRAGVLGTAGRLEIPSLSEGFDELYYVRIAVDNTFVVAEWEQ